MIRRAHAGDKAAIEAFLVPHSETSMFLRSNLAAHGVGQTDHPRSTDFFLWEPSHLAPGHLAGVFGLTQSGNLMAQVPDAPPEAFAGFAAAIAGQEVVGMTGLSDAVTGVLEACGLADKPVSLDRTEPLYRLSLADLTDRNAELRPVSEADRAIFAEWSREYVLETGLSASREAATVEGQRRAARALGGTARLLVKGGVPVAMADLNAQVADMVQIGGVFVPPARRGQGLGGAVTAAILAEARDKGARTAILFAASEAAAQVYESIGFRLVGRYRVVMLVEPQRVAP